jgi:hypothetical protein
MKNILILLFSIIIFFSCTSQVKVLKPEGEAITITLKNNFKYDGELLAVNDTVLFFGFQAKLYEIPLSNVSNVYVHDYSLRKQKILGSTPSFICWTIPFFVEPNIWKGVWIQMVLMEALTVHSCYTGDPKVSFSPPLNNKDFYKLQLYCRYSKGLVPEKWKQLLQYCEQEEFLRLQ